jgi:phosphohistidine phosphatase
LLVGHNPGVSALVSHIADQGYLSIQTGMMVVIELTVDDWIHLGIGTGTVREVLQ